MISTYKHLYSENVFQLKQIRIRSTRQKMQHAITKRCNKKTIYNLYKLSNILVAIANVHNSRSMTIRNQTKRFGAGANKYRGVGYYNENSSNYAKIQEKRLARTQILGDCYYIPLLLMTTV